MFHKKNNTSQASFVVRVLFSNTNMFRGVYVSLSTLTEKQTICFLVLYFNNKQFLASTCPYFVCTNLAFHNKNNRNHFGKKLKKQNKFEEEIERRNHFGEDNNNKWRATSQSVRKGESSLAKPSRMTGCSTEKPNWMTGWPDDRLRRWRDDRMLVSGCSDDRMTDWEDDWMTGWP